MNDIGTRVLAMEERLRKQVYLADGHVVINVEYEYNIPLSACDTAEKILHWVWHLTEKTWMTNEVMRRFIEVVCGINKVDIK